MRPVNKIPQKFDMRRSTFDVLRPALSHLAHDDPGVSN